VIAKLLGIDYGRRRLGFAVSDPSRTFAMPLRTETVRNWEQAFEAIEQTARDVDADCVVIGLPLHMDGTESAMSSEVRKFVTGLRERISLQVILHDERLSSSRAEGDLLAADASRHRRKRSRDKLAARIILQDFLDSHPQKAGECNGTE